jgi:DNA-binding HxlR family transcriptional regulator
MSLARERTKRIDIVLVAISVVILSVALWTWVSALPVAKETVFLATTIALVISLVLVLNVAVLVVIRLQRRVSHLEGIMVTSAIREDPPTEKILVVTLTNTERRIINRLEEHNGQMAQDELRRATGLSKSTLSVTLATLERKSLITRTESGRTKIITLKHDVAR